MSEHVFELSKDDIATIIGNQAAQEVLTHGGVPPFDVHVAFLITADSEVLSATITVKDGCDD